MAFGGWPEEALTFYAGLEADNSKSYWTRNKAVYQGAVQRPMEELVEQLAPEFGEPKIFRPYRDIRFSNDKTPYKTSIAATVGTACYVQFSADGLATGCGMWQMDPPRLSRYRAAVAEDLTGTRLTAIIASLRKAGIDIQGYGMLKTAPRGYDADHPRIDLLRYKGMASWREWPPEPWLHSPEAADRVVAFFRASADLRAWLGAQVGY
jgi:uncharacterized protein (TIGR02453 family)